MQRSVLPAPTHAAGEVALGFRVERVTALDDVKARCYEVSHEATGARMIHLHCHDEEGLFSIGFRTLPEDSTGVAHILEHCVLAGSERFPVKDAFNELGKRTLNTFLNAMTWPDRTVYPVCSAVPKDLFNLAEVYLDLVFRPRLTRETFLQEGHHLEPVSEDDPDGPLRYAGVVYNEMLGVYSSPDAVVRRDLVQTLCPDTVYGHDSGGDPDAIPDLTWEDLRRFHRRYYALPNAHFLTYGATPLEDHLAFLAPRIEAIARARAAEAPGHEASDAVALSQGEAPFAPPVDLQPRWDAPRQSEIRYAIGDDEDPKGRAFVVLAWALNDSADVEETLLLDVLCEALAGSAAGPVRRALIDSGLGEDIFHHGYDCDLRQALGAFGLRGTEATHADRVEEIILTTLRKVADDGLAADLLEAAFHQVELDGKEIVPPFPVMLLMRANPPWFYGADPKAGLTFGALVEHARARWIADARLFEDLVRRWFLDNPHRLRLVAVPSQTLTAERTRAREERLAALRRSLSSEALAALRDQAAALARSQEAPDRPEDLDTLPRLETADIPDALRVVPTDLGQLAGATSCVHPVFSNGVGYVGLSFDCSDLDSDLAPWLPLLSKATFGMGAAGLDYAAMATRIARTTGGIGGDPSAGRTLHTGRAFERFSVDLNLLARDADAASALCEDLLTRSDLTDRQRLQDLVLQSAIRYRSSLVPSGHHYAYRLALAGLGRQHDRREQWTGISQVQLVTTLAREIAGSLDELIERLAALQRRLFTRSRLLVSLAGDPEVLDALRPAFERLVRALPEGEAPLVTAVDASAVGPARNRAFAVPASVCYTAQALSVPDMTDPAAPALELLAALCDSELVYKRVRVQGGAYGGYAYYVPDEGLFSMVSYRDPNLEETFEVYKDVERFARSGVITDEAIESVRLGAIGAYDRILSPEQQLGVARRRYLAEITTEDRLRFREGLRTYKAADVERLALPALAAGLTSAPRGALASRERIERASAALGAPFEVISLDASILDLDPDDLDEDDRADGDGAGDSDSDSGE